MIAAFHKLEAKKRNKTKQKNKTKQNKNKKQNKTKHLIKYFTTTPIETQKRLSESINVYVSSCLQTYGVKKIKFRAFCSQSIRHLNSKKI